MNLLQIDQNILWSLNEFFIGKNVAIDDLFKIVAIYLIYFLPIILLLLWFLNRNKAQRIALVMSMVTLVIAVFGLNKLIAHFWFRARPDLSIVGLKEVFFHRPDFSFPSDHASALFGITFTLYYFGQKKLANWFLIYTVLIVFARIVIAVHYPLDIVGGAIVALIGSTIVWLLRSPLKRYLFDPLVKILRFIKLA